MFEPHDQWSAAGPGNRRFVADRPPIRAATWALHVGARTGACRNALILRQDLARPKRFELLTPRFVVWCSIGRVLDSRLIPDDGSPPTRPRACLGHGGHSGHSNRA